jgi:hypothetical protein
VDRKLNMEKEREKRKKKGKTGTLYKGARALRVVP